MIQLHAHTLFCDVRNMDFQEQRCNIKFCHHLGKTPSETLEMLRKVYICSTMSRSKVYEMYQWGRESQIMNALANLRLHELRRMLIWFLSVLAKIIAKHLMRSLRLLTYRRAAASVFWRMIFTCTKCQDDISHLLTSEEKEERMIILEGLIVKADKNPTFL